MRCKPLLLIAIILPFLLCTVAYADSPPNPSDREGWRPESEWASTVGSVEQAQSVVAQNRSMATTMGTILSRAKVAASLHIRCHLLCWRRCAT